MLRGIRFNSGQFDKTDYNNTFGELTENTIVICRNFDMKKALEQEIRATVNGRTECNDYDCDDEDIGRAEYGINTYLQTVIEINNQKIILCLEPAMVYTAKSIKDIWFLDRRKVGNDYLYTLIPFYAYRGAEDTWAKGLDSIYAQITIGRYGGYTGEWIDDSRKHTIFI